MFMKGMGSYANNPETRIEVHVSLLSMLPCFWALSPS